MSTYREIVGKKIKKVTSDPSTGIDGQMWYNSTTGSIRGLAILEAWASSAPMSTAMDQLGGTGTQTAALAGAGGGLSTFEEYNGLGWVSGGSIPTAMELIAQLAGTQTAAICKGGLTPPPGGPTGRYNNEAYTYDGSSWSSISDSGDARIRGAASGTQTAFFVAGGAGGPPTFTNRLTSSEEYDGSSWTEGGSMSTAREFLSGFGTQTASIMAGGSVPPSYGNSNASEQYDGTSFSSTPNINTARYGLTGSGTSTSNLIYGGGTGSNSAATESYDGTSWSNKPSMATARIYLTRAGDSSSSGLASAGNSGSAVGTTEEFTSSTNIITAAAWATGGNLGTARTEIGGAGSQTASLCAGGQASGSFVTSVEEYNGTSWSEVNDIPTATRGFGGAGTQTASVMFGGENPPSTTITTAYNYDGTNWTSTGALNTDRTLAGNGGTGTQTAALAVAGYEKPGSPPGNGAINAVEEFNGSSWSSNPNNYPASIYSVHHAGTQTAALLWGGATSPGTAQTTSFTYDGSSFSAGATLLTGTVHSAPSGDQTAAMSANDHPQSSVCQFYNGTVWATNPSTSTARHAGSSGKSGAPAPAAWIAGGYTSTFSNATEEFTAETTSGNVKDFTTS